MINLAISLAVGFAVGLAVKLATSLPWVGVVVPGFVAAAAVYILLSQRMRKRLEALFQVMQREVQAKKVDKALQTLQGGFALARWQFLVSAQIHSATGQLLYAVQGDVDAALPHLEKAYSRDWVGRGLLAAARYKKRDVAGAKKVFDDAVKANKKEGVLWAAYAWILEDAGEHEEAIRVLGRAVKANGSDEKLKASLQALQNGKKLKLGKLYAEQWFLFRLEAPPPQFVGPSFRGGKRAIYGRR